MSVDIIEGAMLMGLSTCSNCDAGASLWLEFSSADNQRSYYRCATCGYITEVTQATIGDAKGALAPLRSAPWSTVGDRDV